MPGVALLRDKLSSEVLLRSQSVVRRATQRQVRGHVLATLCERFQVMQLEVASLAAALVARVRERAARVWREHFAPFGRRDVSAALARRRSGSSAGRVVLAASPPANRWSCRRETAVVCRTASWIELTLKTPAAWFMPARRVIYELSLFEARLEQFHRFDANRCQRHTWSLSRQ
jgi:hypothetical protein